LWIPYFAPNIIIKPLLIIVLAYLELFFKIALGPLSVYYTLWEDPVVRGVLCTPRLSLDSFSRLDALETSSKVGKNRETENAESLISENQRPTDS
jgi:hypothetical protein